jgi:hypothetical protein
MQTPSLCNQHRGKYSTTTTCHVPICRFSLVGGESENRVGGILFWSLWVKKHTAAFAWFIFRRLAGQNKSLDLPFYEPLARFT